MSDLRLSNARVRWISGALMLLAGAAFSIGVWQYSAADITNPTAQERRVTSMVTKLMEYQHLSRHPLNDEISKRGFKLFIDGLDPLKAYFYQSDINEFKQYETQLDDMLARYDTSFAHKVFQRFLKRINERVAAIDDLLDRHDFDFTRDEEMITEPDLLHYPPNAAEARERWRQRIKYDLLVLKADKSTDKEKKDPAERDKENREKLSKRYHRFARRMQQFDNDELLEMFLTAITTSYDPHTTYMSQSTLDNFRIAMGLKLEGIGAQLSLDLDGTTVVAKIVPGGAADKDGKLKKDDQIVSVGQDESGDTVDIVGMKLNDVVKLIRGDAGTVVRLGVIPAAKKELVTYKITRAKIKLEDSAAHGEVFEVGSKPDGTPLKVGVIDLPSFYLDMEAARQHARDVRSATTDVHAILNDFNKRKVDAVVLDLRRNGGGSLAEAVELTGLFIDQGPVVQVMDFDKRIDLHNDDQPGMAWSGPLVVLTSKLSASASEILAAAIQDYRRGIVVGDEATHGKGTVQSLSYLGERFFGGPHPPELGALKITVQQFFRPNGASTQRRGVLSDIFLPSITNYMDIGESDLDYAIDFRQIRNTKHATANLVNGDLVTKLQQESGQRVSQSEDFAKLLKRVEAYKKMKARKSVTLNEKKFFEEGDEANAEKEEQKRIAEEAIAENKIKRDYYMNEVLAITRDYVDALRLNRFANVNQP